MKASPKPLISCIWRGDKFAARNVPSRSWLAEGALPHPGIGMLYAYRGSGKTLVAIDLANKLARGRDWFGYAVRKPYTVLYIDGEMPLGDLRDRLVAQAGPEGAPENLFILASEDLAVSHRGLNLATAEDRQAVAQALVDIETKYHESVDLVIFDNWTTLVRGLDENDNSQLDELKQWLILLRHGEKSTLFVHHAGGSGRQRGATAREDVMDYSIKLTGNAGPEMFAWDKTRGRRPDPDSFRLELKSEGPYLTLAASRQSTVGRPPAHDREILAYLASHGASKVVEIAESFNLDKSNTCKIMARLEKLGRVQRMADGSYSEL